MRFFHPSPRTGFTLVELAMASFLVAIGLLGVYALLRSGIESGDAQERDIRGSLFAEGAMATLEAASVAAARTSSTNWVEFWESFFNGSTNLPLLGASSDDWPSTTEETSAAGEFTGALPTRLLYGKGRWAYYYAMQDVASVSNTVWYEFSEPELPSSDDHPPLSLSISLHVWPETPQSTAQTYFRVFSYRGGSEEPLP